MADETPRSTAGSSRRGEQTPEQVRQGEAERLRAAAEQQNLPDEDRLDETVEGGRYIVDGRTVNADGKALEGKGAKAGDGKAGE